MPPNSHIMLAIELSQREGGVALMDAAGNVHSKRIDTRRRRDDRLIPTIDQLVSAAGLLPRDLATVAVSIGPGGFTGLRISITTARILAEITGATLVAVPSALVAADASADRLSGTRIMVAVAGRRGAAWVTVCQRADANAMWQIAGTPQLVAAEALQLASVDAMLADEHLPPSFSERCDKESVAIVQPVWTAASCLAIGQGMLELKETTQPLHLQPLYARQPEAVTIWAQREAEA